MSRSKSTALMAIAILLGGCDTGFRDPVVRACVQDGQPYDYCDCSATGMRKVLGLKRYLVYADLVLMGGADSAGPEDILKLMEKHALTPTDFAEIRGVIGELGSQIHRQCTD